MPCVYRYETTQGISYETSDLTEYETPSYESSVIWLMAPLAHPICRSSINSI